MKIHLQTTTVKKGRTLAGGQLLLLCLALFFLVGGCSPSQRLFSEKAPETVVDAGMPTYYGVVLKVEAAEMAGKEIRKGDLAITVELDSGGIVMIIQPEDDIYTVGDRVRLFRGGSGFVRAQLLQAISL